MSTTLHTPTNNLQASLDFYSKLNFTILSENRPTLVSDGSVIIEINPNRFARAGVKLYRQSWADTVEKLQTETSVIKQENGYALVDCSGVWIYLVENEFDSAVLLASSTSSTLGNFAGMTLETISIEKSLKIWEQLGFLKTMGSEAQGWASCENADNLTVNFMKPNICPHLFFNPSLTYFNGKNNLEIIRNIRAANIDITEEITNFNDEGIVDNVIIRDPGGYGFFIFND